MAERRVEFSPRAREDLAFLSPDVARRISAKVRELALDARPRGDTIRRLSGLNVPTYRLRIGDYRVVFRAGPGFVWIFRVIHRSRLHRALEDLR